MTASRAPRRGETLSPYWRLRLRRGFVLLFRCGRSGVERHRQRSAILMRAQLAVWWLERKHAR